MPSIGLTNNTTLNVTASSTDGNATLNRHLTSPLSFFTQTGLSAIAVQKIEDLDPAAFPIAASATGEGKFAVEGTSLDVQLGASASVGLLTSGDAAAFFSAVEWAQDPAVAALISFGVQCSLNGAGTPMPAGLPWG